MRCCFDFSDKVSQLEVKQEDEHKELLNETEKRKVIIHFFHEIFLRDH